MFDSARDRSQREIRAAPSVGCFRGGWEKERKGKRERRGTGRKSLIPLGIWRFCRRKKRADFCDEKVHFKGRFFGKAVGAGFAEKAILITAHDVGGGENHGKVTRGMRLSRRQRAMPPMGWPCHSASDKEMSRRTRSARPALTSSRSRGTSSETRQENPPARSRARRKNLATRALSSTMRIRRSGCADGPVVKRKRNPPKRMRRRK